MADIVNKAYYLKSVSLWLYWSVNPVNQQHRISRDLPSLVLKEDHDHASELIEQVTSLPRLPTRASYCEGADTPKNKNKTFTYTVCSVPTFIWGLKMEGAKWKRSFEVRRTLNPVMVYKTIKVVDSFQTTRAIRLLTMVVSPFTR